MRSVAIVVLVIFVLFYVRIFLRRRGGIVAKRGMSVGADLATMNDQRRVRVESVAKLGPDRARVLFRPEAGGGVEEFVVVLHRDFEEQLLRDWGANQDLLAIVVPEGTHLIRLRSTASLQHLTLRRADES